MLHFYIITNRVKDPQLAVTNSIMSYLREKGQKCTLCEASRSLAGAGYRYTNPADIPDDTDFIIVLGGDGTLLLSATDTIDRQIPLLGVNLGTLGYLAEVDRTSIMAAADDLIRGEYQLERRMLLRGTVVRKGGATRSEIALNDIVIRRDDAPGMITLKNYVNGSWLNSYKADGMIISTPTGSTGYTLSVGGPIISPKAELIMMTPLAAHELNSRSIIFPHQDRIRVEIGPGRDGGTEHAAAYFDGSTKVQMETGDSVEVTQAEKTVQFVKLHNDSFLETLSRKMNNQ